MRSFFQRRQQQPAQLATAIGYEFFPMLFAAAWCNCPTRSAPLRETRKMLPIRRKRTLTPFWSKYAPVPHECTPLIVRRTTSTKKKKPAEDGVTRNNEALLPFYRTVRTATRRRGVLCGETFFYVVPRVSAIKFLASFQSDRWNFDDEIKRPFLTISCLDRPRRYDERET